MKTLMSALAGAIGARQRHTTFALTLSSLLVLGACGGGGGGGGGSTPPASGPPRPAETLFTDENAWEGELPDDAETIDSDEFRRMHEAGEIQIVTSPDSPEQEAARRQKIEEELDFLESQTDLSDDVKELIERARASEDYLGDSYVELPDGEVVGTLDLGTRVEMAARHYREARDPAAVRARYALFYSLLTEELKEQVPSPESLESATLGEIKVAEAELNTALESLADLDGTRLDPDALVPEEEDAESAGSRKQAVLVDNDGTCAPSGLARTYWFPLRNFVSPMKQQGRRGTCWAFTAIGAVESRERVQNDNPVDLSEQFLVNQVKHRWIPSEFVDGGSAAEALNAAADRNAPLMTETQWPYNPAWSRPANAFQPGVEGTAASYANACNGYVPANRCSETAHQSPRVCTNVGGSTFCANAIVGFTGPGVMPSRAYLLWASGQEFNLNAYRALLASGVSIIASFPVYEGFSSIGPDGRLTDYEPTGDGTGHLVLIVGFISNEDMTFGPLTSHVGGGGYFVIKNSWGCNSGDAGYYYIPADYVSTRFSSLEALEFDALRSQRWIDDQRIPGGTAGLEISTMGVSTVDLRVETNLANTFEVRQPGASHVHLTVTSDRDGLLYNGQFMVEEPAIPSGTLFGTDLWTTFQTEGLRTLTLTARYGTQVVTATKQVIAANTGPQIRFEALGTPQEGEPFVLTAEVTDKNEPVLTNVCNAMEWTVEEPDQIVSGTGCMRTIRFGVAGARNVRVTTQDAEGAVASLVETFDVAPPPENPYPRVTKAALYSSDRRDGGVFELRCVWNEVPWESVIDLRQRACSMLIGDDTPRYLAELTVENPLEEALSYEWTLSGYYDGDIVPRRWYTVTTTTPSFEVEPMVFGGRDAANRCTIDVTVIAPEPTRNKRVRAWSGRCIQIEDAPK